MKKLLIVLAAAGLLFSMQGTFADSSQVSGGVMIGGPAHAGTPPDMVWVPRLRLYVAVGSSSPVVFLDSYYYLRQRGHWYRGSGYDGPWRRIKVPPPGIRALRARDWPAYRRAAERYHGNPHYRQFRAAPYAGRPPARGPHGRGRGPAGHARGAGAEERGRSYAR